MAQTKCKAICHPSLPFGTVCGNKTARWPGIFCIPCRDNAIQLMKSSTNHRFTNDEMNCLLSMWLIHLSLHEDVKKGKARNNQTHCTNQKRVLKD